MTKAEALEKLRNRYESRGEETHIPVSVALVGALLSDDQAEGEKSSTKKTTRKPAA